jgi:hypothetical protein
LRSHYLATRNNTTRNNNTYSLRHQSSVAADARVQLQALCRQQGHTVEDNLCVSVNHLALAGLCVARKLLQDTDLSVALLDAKQPCAGATGAGGSSKVGDEPAEAAQASQTKQLTCNMR